jgi:predicted CXXCH cytochrome family protein
VAGAALGLMIVSCETVDRVVVIPPNIPGATFIGSKECAQCHEEIYRDFATASHARIMAKGPNALNMGCESCHGPGSLHAESGGDRRTVTNYRPGAPRRLSGVQRQTIINPRRSVENCFECHLDKRGQFEMPHHHPVPEHKMSCGDCHDPHKGPATKGGGTALLSENRSCLKCHTAQVGPHVFEHEALREGCTVCHDPHGSMHPKLLLARDSTLCLKCHFQQVRGGRILIGGSDHTRRVEQGACWTGGCHEAVHGSQVSSSLRF